MNERVVETLDCVAEGAAWLCAHEPRFGVAMQDLPPLPLRRKPDGFAELLSAITSQQVSVASAAAIWGRLQDADLIGPGKILASTDEDLRALGLSRQKARYARALAEAGADMILVPSNTDFAAGQTRVRQSCRARAIEQQCLVVQAPLIGDVPQCTVLDTQTGRAALFCPPDHGLPASGIIAQGETDKPAWVIADVDPSAITAPRQSGQVGNFHHWDEQDKRVKTVTTVPV